MIRLTVRCLLGICLWYSCANVPAQDAPTPPAEKKSESPLRATVVQRVPLDPIIEFDAEGKRSLLLPEGWSLTFIDDFLKFLQRELQPTVPPFILRNVSATGTIADDYVEANIQIDITTTCYQPVRIPLGFKEGILPSENQPPGQSPFRYTGSGAAHLTVDPQERQYIAVIVPQTESETTEATQRHTLSLLLWLPLTQNGSEENRLSVSFPQSNSSLFHLDVPMVNVDASVTQGSILDAQDNAEKQTTTLRVQGLRADTEITWQKKKTEVVEDQPVLLVERASIDVRLDARSTVYDAILPISSATGSFDQLQIRLPQGCRLDREMTDRYAATGDYTVGDADEESVVLVQFQQKMSPLRATGSVLVRLRAIQQFDENGDKPDFSRELAGFEVLGAERQSGSLTVSVFPADLKSHWELVRGVRRTDSGQTGGAGAGASLSANETRFDFISQPFLLRVQAVPPKIRINVKPEYRFHIRKGLISMTAQFNFTVSGAKTDVLYILLSDSQWRCDFGTSNLVDTVGVTLDDSGLLTVPLRSAMEGTIDVELRAYRTISSEEAERHRIVLPMPKPQANWTESAPVTIAADINVEVQPIDESYGASAERRTSGLTRQPRRTMPTRSDLTDFQQESLFYRTEPTGGEFIADLIYHQQKISAAMQTEVRLFEEYNLVTQSIAYTADYAPMDRLYFLIPKALDASGDIQVRLDNRSLELRDTIVDSRENVPDGWTRKLILLPEPLFRFRLTFQYPPPPITVATDVTALYSLPFICPAEVPVTDHSIQFFTPSGYKVELQDESKPLWESIRETRRPSSASPLRASPLRATSETYRSARTPMQIALSVSVFESNISGATIVERAWLQTWLTGVTRQDRAVYFLKTTNDSLTIQLPPNSTREHGVDVRVDRRQITPNISPMGVLTIPILPEQHNRTVEVSVDYRYTFSATGVEWQISLPTFARDTLVQREFWQVILPQDQHIIGCPTGWTPEFDLAWNGLFWGRVPSIQKNDIGFDPDSEDVKAIIVRSSQYVFSHLQPPSAVTLYIVKRSYIVLCSSGLALLIGLMLIYVPQSRYAGSLFGLGVALFAVLFYQPPLVLLMLQAAAFGVILALGTGYVYRIFHRQKQWISPAPMFEERTHISHIFSQTVHEVIIDGESADQNEPVVANNHNNNNTPPKPVQGNG
jgi:hypothetical protein